MYKFNKSKAVTIIELIVANKTTLNVLKLNFLLLLFVLEKLPHGKLPRRRFPPTLTLTLALTQWGIRWGKSSRGRFYGW